MTLERQCLEDEGRSLTICVHQLLQLVLMKATTKTALEIGIDDDGERGLPVAQHDIFVGDGGNPKVLPRRKTKLLHVEKITLFRSLKK